MDHSEIPDRKDTEHAEVCEPMEQAKEDIDDEKPKTSESEDKNTEKDKPRETELTEKNTASTQPTGIPALISDEPDENQEEEKSGPKFLDLAFAMDCTGSMGSYIHQAQQNIRKIVEDIVSKEEADVRLALVEYRDHPPQDDTFVTRVHDFTSSVREMKTWLDASSAQGGGDGPEAVADALHQVLKLNWRQEAAKICVFISDAPPHGLGLDSGDGFPNGCPDGLDPMEIAGKLAEKSITIYLVGCEPSINRYKEFFTAIAHITGGQYLPLSKAKLLSAVITGGAQEELSLQQLYEEVNVEVQQELQGAGEGSVGYDELASRVHSKMQSRGHQTVQLQMNQSNLPKASVDAQMLSYCTSMKEVRKKMHSSSKIQGHSEIYRTASKSKKKRTSAHSTRVASDGGGMMGGIKSWLGFGGSQKSAEPEDSEEDYDVCRAAAAPSLAPCAASSSSEPTEDVYGVVKGKDIAEEQVYRMVSRSLAANQLRSKTHAQKSE